MPNTNFISNLLEIKDLIVDNIEFSSTDIHLYFHLQRRDVSCPFCSSVTNKVHDYRPSVIKDAPVLGKHLLLHYKKDDTIAITAGTTLMNRFHFYLNAVVSPQGLLSLLSIN